MLGIRFMKSQPTTYVLHFRNGQVVREGPGLSFFYYRPSSSIVSIPLAVTELPFVFNELTSDFQPVTIQGQIAWRVADPRRLAAALDFSLGDGGDYASEDPDKLGERIVHAAQVIARGEVHRRGLKDALAAADALAAEVLPRLKADPAVAGLGVEVLAMQVLSIRPAPETGRALEAEAREAMMRQSDQAVYDRRNAAVEQERRIKESELSTEIAVEEKKRRIRETKMAADIAIEKERAALIDQQVANDRKDAEARGYVLETTLKPVKGLDWKTLVALTAGGGDARTSIALAFRELAENAGKIGELNVSPDLLKTLIDGKK